MAHQYIVECNTVQCSAAVEKEEESYHLCVEFVVPRELFLQRDRLMPFQKIGFERFEEKELDHATIPEK